MLLHEINQLNEPTLLCILVEIQKLQMWSTPYWIPISTYVVVHTYILSTYCLQLDTLTLALLSYSLHWKSIYFYNTTFYTIRKKIPATLSTKYIITYLYTIQNYISILTF